MRTSHLQNTLSHSPDNEDFLVRSAAAGSKTDFGYLYQHYYPRLRMILIHITGDGDEADELLQQTFLKVWERKEQLLLVKSFQNYVLRIAKNQLFDHLRKKKVHQRAIEQISSYSQTIESSSEDMFLFKQYYNTANEAIAKLPPQQKKVFLLRAQGGLSFDEISVQLGISYVMVKKHYYKACHEIRAHMTKHREWPIILPGLFLLLHQLPTS